MIREAFSHAGVENWQLFALIFFIVLFIGLIVWIFRKGSAEKYQETASLPLVQEDQWKKTT